MPKKMSYSLMVFVLGFGVAVHTNSLGAQEKTSAEPPSTNAEVGSTLYRLEYVVREVENSNTINSRKYSVISGIMKRNSLRVGSMFNYSSGKEQTSGAFVGINIDYRIMTRPEDNRGLVSTTFDSSTVVGPEKTAQSGVNPVPGTPVIRTLKFSADVMFALGKPTVIATLDDVATNRRYEVEVTVTKVE